MKRLILIAAGCVASGLALAQSVTPSGQHLNPIGQGHLPSGQGNILHPGVPSVAPPAASPQPPAVSRARANGNVRARGEVVYVPYVVGGDPFYAGYPGGPIGGNTFEPPPGQYDPIFGRYNPGASYSAEAPSSTAPPMVIINQNFQPETVRPMLRDYSDAALPQPGGAEAAPARSGVAEARPQAAALRDDEPTIFLIAMKDHTIYPVIAYWVDKDVLNYVTVESVVKRVPLDQVDRDLSRTLNDQRNVEFKLPGR
jgi:hypothetical protein